MVDETLLTLAADIVSAHVSNNAVTADELPALIEAVYGSIAQLGAPTEVVAEKREPAVSIRASVKADVITCLECGAKLKTLKRHLQVEHGLSAEEYRKRWNLKSDYPIVAPEYAARRKELAKQIGLGRKVSRKKAQSGAPEAPAAAPAVQPTPRKRAAKSKVQQN